MYLSYSGFKKADLCLQSYWHGYINKTVLPEPDNRVGMLYGAVVGKLFEYFYKDRLWHAPDPIAELNNRVPRVMKRQIEWETKNGTFDWSKSKVYSSFEDVEKDVRETIPRGLNILRRHRLVGLESNAEVKLDTDFNGHLYGGRADFIVRRLSPQGDLVVLDGKGSRWRDKYVDRRQLKWYAMLFYERHKIVPDKLGFVYWKFEPHEAIDWVDCTVRDVEILREAVHEVVVAIEAGQKKLAEEHPEGPKRRSLEAFPVKPTRECTHCPYLPVCEEGTAFMKREKPELSTAAGVEDVGL